MVICTVTIYFSPPLHVPYLFRGICSRTVCGFVWQVEGRGGIRVSGGGLPAVMAASFSDKIDLAAQVKGGNVPHRIHTCIYAMIPL